MRLTKVLVSIILCFSLTACSQQQGSDPVVDYGEKAHQDESVAIAKAKTLVSQVYRPYAYNRLVRLILEEYDAEDISKFKVLYFKYYPLDVWGNPFLDESGGTTMLNDENMESSMNVYPFFFILQEPSGNLAAYIRYENGLTENWTWLYEHLCSVEISELEDELGRPKISGTDVEYIQTQKFQDFCAGNFQEEYFSRITPYDPASVDDFRNQDSATQNATWMSICTGYGNNIFHARYVAELNRLPDKQIDAFNLLLLNGCMEVYPDDHAIRNNRM